MQNSQASATPRRVLVVDDSRAIQAIIRRILETSETDELQVQCASSGAEALAQVDSFRPDLVLSDWHMPGVSGIEMLQTLRQMGHADVALGFVTTETATDCLAQARRNGAAFVLNKPFQDHELRAAVSQCLKPAMAMVTADPAIPRVAAIDSVSQLQQLLFTHLGTRSFVLSKRHCAGVFVEQTPQMVVLYGSAGRKGAYALGLLDASASCLIGGMAAGNSPDEIRTMISKAQPGAGHFEHAQRFMLAVAGLLHKRSPADVPAFSVAKMAQQPFDKVAALIANNNGRSDFELGLSGLGEGRMSFFIL